MIGTPSFGEVGDCDTTKGFCLSSDPNRILPWIITSPNKEYEIGTSGSIKGVPSQYLDLNPYKTPITITQVIPTNPKNSFTLSYFVASNPWCSELKGNLQKEYEVTAGDQVKQLTVNSDIAKQEKVVFSSKQNWAIIQFKSLHTASECGAVIYGVSVTRNCSK
jgi:hypothetical protein